MKAIVCTKYGPPDVLQLKEVEKPVPKENEILIRVFATAVNSGDWILRKPDTWLVRLFFGLTKPRKQILGVAFSGEIEATGKSVVKLKTGEQVFGSTGMKMGAYAEYICLPEDGVFALKPGNISHTEAASIPFGGTTALYFLKKANVKQEQKVLIYGASGAVGTAAIQLAKYFGASVTGVCSTSNLEMVKSFGADNVIDYTKEDLTKISATYDIVFETVGKLPFRDCIGLLNKQGTLILAAAGPSDMLKGVWNTLTGKRKIISGLIKEKAEDIIFLKGLIEMGNFKPVVDKVYPLEQIAEAHKYVESGHKKGNVAIKVRE